MFPKRGQVWTYRERTRFLALMGVFPVIFFIAVGVYFAITEANWLILAVGVVALGGVALYFFSNERNFRGEP